MGNVLPKGGALASSLYSIESIPILPEYLQGTLSMCMHLMDRTQSAQYYVWYGMPNFIVRNKLLIILNCYHKSAINASP